ANDFYAQSFPVDAISRPGPRTDPNDGPIFYIDLGVFIDVIDPTPDLRKVLYLPPTGPVTKPGTGGDPVDLLTANLVIKQVKTGTPITELLDRAFIEATDEWVKAGIGRDPSQLK